MAQDLAVELKRGYRLALILGGAGTVGALPIYALVFEIIRRKSAIHALEIMQPGYAFGILIGLTVLTAILIEPMTNLVLSNKLSMGRYDFGRFSPPVRKLIGLTQLVSGMAHTLGVAGFILSLFTAQSMYVYFGILLSLGLTVKFFPRFSQWEEWIAVWK